MCSLQFNVVSIRESKITKGEKMNITHYGTFETDLACEVSRVNLPNGEMWSDILEDVTCPKCKKAILADLGFTHQMPVQDNDCHWFIIPAEKEEEWYNHLDSEDYGYIDIPWAKEVGGCLSLIEFYVEEK